MFSQIRDKFAKYVSPVVLLEHPTIAQLASYLDAGNSAKPLEAIVPLKSSGRRPPLFCIHSGGAHVFFYKNLAKYIHDDQPLYAIRPKGLSDDAPFHDTIENMASYYLAQIRQVQPEGPYFLLGTCFSNAVGLEMCHQLTSINEKVGILIIIDSGPAHLQPPTQPGKRKPFRRMLAMMQKGNWHGIRKKFGDRYARLADRVAPHGQSEADLKLKEMIHSLNNLYVNYTWKPYAGKIFLIRSSEFSARRDKQFHIDQWLVLAEGQLAIEVVKGHHLTLFEEPEVKNLAEKISSCLQPD
jgi:thioesterase domain-containing protein